MDLAPLLDTTINRIESKTFKKDNRGYLGASILGNSCERYLWLTFRNAYEVVISHRVERIFETGDIYEERLRKLLNDEEGISTWADQEEFVFAFGHAKGHIDDRGIGFPEAPKTEHLVEYKSMNDTYFKQVERQGVKEAKPLYYAQMQLGMHFTKLKRGFYFAVNKNDENLYPERIPYDKLAAEILVKKAEVVVETQFVPKKPYSKSWYLCKFCDARKVCHEGHTWLENCRTCVHAYPNEGGTWGCYETQENITDKSLNYSCDAYKSLQS